MNKIESIQSMLNKASDLLRKHKVVIRDIYTTIMSENQNVKAMVYHRSNDTIREYTYKEYDNLVKSTANRLSVLLQSVKINSVVALKLNNTPTWCILFWAILMAGYRPLLIDVQLPHDETQKMLKLANAEAIISDDEIEFEGILSATRNDMHNINERSSFGSMWADEIIFCTSGTTGEPKLVIFNGYNLINQLNASTEMPKENLDITYPQTLGPLTLLALIPFHHIFAFVAIFLWYTFYNSTLFFTAIKDPKTILTDIKKYQITHIYHVPLFYEAMLKFYLNSLSDKSKIKFYNLVNLRLNKISKKEAGFFINKFEKNTRNNFLGQNIKYMISGGGALSENISETYNALGYPLYNGYGMTEVGVTSVDLSQNLNTRIKRSIGHPLVGIKYKLGKNDELLIKSPTIHLKEIINGKVVATKFDEDGFYPTGDIAQKDEDGLYYIRGRLKDVIISSNGENVYPENVEAYFRKIDSIDNLVVFGDKYNHIILVIKTENKISVNEEVQNVIKNLPWTKRPFQIVYTNEDLPMTANLKVKRYLVKQLFEKGAYGEVKPPVPINILKNYDKKVVNDMRKKVTKIFQQVLFIKGKMKTTAHWINDLHSDSMTYITLVNEIEKAFKTKIPVEKYGKLTCIDEFVKELIDSNCK